jgi:hypothetical protein
MTRKGDGIFRRGKVWRLETGDGTGCSPVPTLASASYTNRLRTEFPILMRSFAFFWKRHEQNPLHPHYFCFDLNGFIHNTGNSLDIPEYIHGQGRDDRSE